MGCEKNTIEHHPEKAISSPTQLPPIEVKEQSIPHSEKLLPKELPTVDIYPFLRDILVQGTIQRLEDYKPTPSGYTRVDISENMEQAAFASWLRGLPIVSRSEVYSYNGELLHKGADGIIPISVGNRDLQQCADSILRIYAEFLWSKNLQKEWGIHFTSGDDSTWKDWSEGERFRVGKRVERYNNGLQDNSYEQYQNWLRHSFLYAGTLSLHKDAIKVAMDDDIQPGDFFLTGGSPGHVVMVLDVATKEGSPPIGIIAQGFMPAQEFHIISDTGRHVIDNWFALPTTDTQALTIPNWSPFFRHDLYRFPNPHAKNNDKQ